MELEIDISKRNFFIVIAALFVFSGILLVNAYNTRSNELPTTPEKVGHTPDELHIEWNNVLNKPSGFVDNNDAGAPSCGSGQIQVGSSCKTIPSCSSSQATRWTGSGFKCVNNPPPPPPPASYSWKYFARYNPDYSCESYNRQNLYRVSHLNMANEPTYTQFWPGPDLTCAAWSYSCERRSGLGTNSVNGRSCSSSQEGLVCISGSLQGCLFGDCITGSKNKYKCTKD